MLPAPDTLTRAKSLIAEIEKLQAELASLFGAAPAKRRGRPPGSGKAAAVPTVVAAAPAAPKKKRRMSPEGRARIAAAAKARWAKFRTQQKKA